MGHRPAIYSLRFPGARNNAHPDSVIQVIVPCPYPGIAICFGRIH